MLLFQGCVSTRDEAPVQTFTWKGHFSRPIKEVDSKNSCVVTCLSGGFDELEATFDRLARVGEPVDITVCHSEVVERETMELARLRIVLRFRPDLRDKALEKLDRQGGVTTPAVRGGQADLIVEGVDVVGAAEASPDLDGSDEGRLRLGVPPRPLECSRIHLQFTCHVDCRHWGSVRPSLATRATASQPGVGD